MKLGVNSLQRIQCRKSEHHGFHPADEQCAWCEPPATEPEPTSSQYDSTSHSWMQINGGWLWYPSP